MSCEETRSKWKLYLLINLLSFGFLLFFCCISIATLYKIQPIYKRGLLKYCNMEMSGFNSIMLQYPSIFVV